MQRPWWKSRPALVVLAVLVVVAVLTSLDLALSAGRIHARVSVDGVAVGGMKPDAALAVLKRELPGNAVPKVTLVSDEASWTVSPGDIGLTYNFPALVEQAMSFGRDGSTISDTIARLGAWVHPVSLAPTATADPEKLGTVFEAVAAAVEVPPRDASVVIDGADGSVRPSVLGVALQKREAEARLIRAFLAQTDSTVTVPLGSAPARVSDEAAQAALEVARAMMSAPVDVTFDDKSWTFSPEEIGTWISFRTPSETTSGTLEVFIDPEAASETVLPRVGTVGRAAKDASFKVSNGRVSIVPSQDGVGPNMESLALELSQVLQDPARPRSVALRTSRVQPKITTEDAQGMGIKERLSRYTTTFSASNRPRVNNIRTLADAIDGTLIAPGGTFSFNETVGPRTAEKGYQEAPAIVNGKLVPQLGGGICQVGTTFFNAVFESGLPVVQRRNHSYYIDHYPKGRDATVSWGGPDLKFRNDTDHWVLVVTDHTSSSLTVALYGTDPGYDVKAEVGEWKNVRPFKTETVPDPKLPKGAKVVEDAGVTGRTITVRRIVMRGTEIIRTDTFTSVYTPKTEVVRVGTKVVAQGSTATTTPQP